MTNFKAEEISANSDRNDLAGAIVAGFSAGVLQSLITALFRDLTLRTAVRYFVIGIPAYFLVGVLLQRFWRNRLAPNWVLTSLFGSILFVAASLTPAVIEGWYDPYNSSESLIDYLSVEVDVAGSIVILLHLATLPIMAIFHYARAIVTAMRKWHAGPEPTSILRSECQIIDL